VYICFLPCHFARPGCSRFVFPSFGSSGSFPLLTMAVSIYFMKLYFFAVSVSSVLPLNRTVVFWGDFSVGREGMFVSHLLLTYRLTSIY